MELVVDTHTHTQTHAHTRTHTNTHTHTRAHTHKHTHTHARTQTHTRARAHTHKHTRTHARTQTHTHTHARTHTRTHTHTAIGWAARSVSWFFDRHTHALLIGSLLKMMVHPIPLSHTHLFSVCVCVCRVVWVPRGAILVCHGEGMWVVPRPWKPPKLEIKPLQMFSDHRQHTHTLTHTHLHTHTYTHTLTHTHTHTHTQEASILNWWESLNCLKVNYYKILKLKIKLERFWIQNVSLSSRSDIWIGKKHFVCVDYQWKRNETFNLNKCFSAAVVWFDDVPDLFPYFQILVSRVEVAARLLFWS